MILHGDVKPKEREEVFVPSSPWTHSTHHTYYAPQDLRKDTWMGEFYSTFHFSISIPHLIFRGWMNIIGDHKV